MDTSGPYFSPLCLVVSIVQLWLRFPESGLRLMGYTEVGCSYDIGEDMAVSSGLRARCWGTSRHLPRPHRQLLAVPGSPGPTRRKKYHQLVLWDLAL